MFEYNKSTIKKKTGDWTPWSVIVRDIILLYAHARHLPWDVFRSPGSTVPSTAVYLFRWPAPRARASCSRRRWLIVSLSRSLFPVRHSGIQISGIRRSVVIHSRLVIQRRSSGLAHGALRWCVFVRVFVSDVYVCIVRLLCTSVVGRAPLRILRS